MGGGGRGLKQQEVLISQVFRLVQNQDVGKIGSFRVCEGRLCSRPFSLVCRWWSSYSHVFLTSLGQVSPFKKDTSHTAFESHPAHYR